MGGVCASGGCVLMACIKKSNNLTDGEGLDLSRLCDGEQLLKAWLLKELEADLTGGGVSVYGQSWGLFKFN